MKPAQGFAQIIVLILVVLVFGAVALVTYLKFFYLNTPFMRTETKMQNGTLTLPADETANWKTYTNAKFKYVLQYPNDFDAFAEKPIDVREMVDIEKGPNVVFQISAYPETKTLDQVKQVLLSYTLAPAINLTETKVNGIDAISYRYKVDTTYAYITVIRNGTRYDLAIANSPISNSPISNQILSTFKFTN